MLVNESEFSFRFMNIDRRQKRVMIISEYRRTTLTLTNESKTPAKKSTECL